jgi:hypothetical protein
MHTTYEDARQALADAEADVAGDMGQEAVEAGWGDLVHAVAGDCTPDVAAELLRRNL